MEAATPTAPSPSRLRRFAWIPVLLVVGWAAGNAFCQWGREFAEPYVPVLILLASSAGVSLALAGWFALYSSSARIWRMAPLLILGCAIGVFFSPMVRRTYTGSMWPSLRWAWFALPDELLDGVQQARAAQQVEHLRVQVHRPVFAGIRERHVVAEVSEVLAARIRHERRQPVDDAHALELVA